MPAAGHVTVTWDKQPINVRIVGPLARSAAVVEHVDGTDPSTVHTTPGRIRFEPLLLERDITKDSRFEAWADLVSSAGATSGTAFRKDVLIELFDDAGAPMASFKVLRAWPSTYRALAPVDVGADTPPTEVVILHHDGWVRLV